MNRRAFRESVHFFVKLVRRVPEEAWDRPALGVWSVRDLVGHAWRALWTVREGLSRPVHGEPVAGPAGYFRLALERTTDEAIARRGREAGARLGSSPAQAVEEMAHQTLHLVARHRGQNLVATPVGPMRLDDYLATRVVELTLHTLDLARALGWDVQPPREAIRATLHVLADLALERDVGATVALALGGRIPLPEGFSLF